MIDLDILVQDYEVLHYHERCKITGAEPSIAYDTDLVIAYLYTGAVRSLRVNGKTLVAAGFETDDHAPRVRKKARSVAKDVWFLRLGQHDWPKDGWIDTKKFDDIESAKDHLASVKAKLLATNSPYAVRLRKDTEMAEQLDFDQWAEFRFASGDWVKLPWANEPWVKPEIENLHFAHFSKAEGDPSVAYWESTARAQSDHVSTMNVGRYLNHYYGDVLTPHQIEDWVHKADPPGELIFSGTNPEDIYEAYSTQDASGLHSCMVYRDDQNCHDGVPWRCNGQSPVRVYGGGDLEVATLIRNDRRVARALVWRERKAVGRMYGDIGRMKTALMAHGFEHDGNWTANDMHTTPQGLLSGARLLKIEVEGQPGNFAMPYIDFSYKVVDQGDHFILDKYSGQNAHRTDGLLNPYEEMSECDRCGCDQPEDEMREVGSGVWCQPCYDDYSITCERYESAIPTSNAVEVEGEDWCPRCVQNHSTVCDCCSDRIASCNANPAHNAEGNRIEDLCEDCAPGDDNTDDYVMIRGQIYQTAALLGENA